MCTNSIDAGDHTDAVLHPHAMCTLGYVCLAIHSRHAYVCMPMMALQLMAHT